MKSIVATSSVQFFSFSSNFKIFLQNYHPPLTVGMKSRKNLEVSEYTTRAGYSKTISTYSAVYLFSYWSGQRHTDKLVEITVQY